MQACAFVTAPAIPSAGLHTAAAVKPLSKVCLRLFFCSGQIHQRKGAPFDILISLICSIQKVNIPHRRLEDENLADNPLLLLHVLVVVMLILLMTRGHMEAVMYIKVRFENNQCHWYRTTVWPCKKTRHQCI